MMSHTPHLQETSIPLPITGEALRTARQFAAQQNDAVKKEQVYLNTLAVYAVNNYLEMIDIPTELSASDCWHPVIRFAADIADLKLTELGSLECRPIKPGDTTCYIPPEVRENRIAYLVVEINEQDKQATLLGFSKTAAAGDLNFQKLQTMDDFVEYLQKLSEPEVSLSDWFDDVFLKGWQTLDEIVENLGSPPPNLSYSFRIGESYRDESANIPNAVPALIDLLHTTREKGTLFPVIDLLGRIAYENAEAISALTQVINHSPDLEIRRQAAVSLGRIQPENSLAGVRRAKVLDFGIRLNNSQVVLVITLMPESENKANIHLRVYPIGEYNRLPANLKLSLLDESQASLMTVESRQADNAIQLEFRAEKGDTFSLRLSLADASVTEYFVV